MATAATATSQQRLAADIATYLAIPVSKRTPAQVTALATDQATYARQQRALSLGGGSSTNTPVQSTSPSGVYGNGPVANGAGAGSSGTVGDLVGAGANGTNSGSLLLLAGGALLILFLLRK